MRDTKSYVNSTGSSFGFFFQAEDGIRGLVRSRGLGDVYKRQTIAFTALVTTTMIIAGFDPLVSVATIILGSGCGAVSYTHLTLPTIYSV